MGKKNAPPFVKKSVGAKSAAPSKQQQRQAAAPGLTKDAAGNFLKQRMSKKLKDLRAPGLSELAAKPVVETVGAASASSLIGLKAEAEKRGCDFAEQEACEEPVDTFVAQEGLNREREAENTRRKFYVELRKVLAAADVIVEVLDARDPQACRSLELEKQATSSGKRLVLLLNKIDLVPKHVVEAWTKHLKRSFPTLAFKAAHGGAKRVVHAQTSAMNAPEGLLSSTHAVVGADELMQLFKNYSRSGDGKKSLVTVGIVGYPNTGKSSVINSMKRHCAVETGGRSGVTKIMQEVSLDSKVTLIDCPGIVFEGSSADPSVVLRNVVRVESVPDPVGVVDAMILKAPRPSLLKFYGLNRDFTLVRDFLIHVAQTRGKLKKGGGLDLENAAKSIISDWTTGKFRYYAVPPTDSAAADAQAVAESVEIVSGLSAALDIDALCGGHGAQPSVLGAPQDADEGMDCAVGCDIDMG